MKDHYDFSNARKNPHAARLKKEGFTIQIRYSPEDIENDHFDDTKDIIEALVDLMSIDESKRLLLHIKNNYNLSCSSDVWEGLEEYEKQAQ